MKMKDRPFGKVELSIEIFLERVAGIEPASAAWKAAIITTIRYPQRVREINTCVYFRANKGGLFEAYPQ